MDNCINAVNLTNECTALARIDQSKMGNMIPERIEMQNRADVFIFDREVHNKYAHVLHIIKQSMKINIWMLACAYFVHAKCNYELAELIFCDNSNISANKLEMYWKCIVFLVGSMVTAHFK